ncbi:MAG: alginate lyase family protein [Armatimonadetes bacterium]|nr:alginate lyase family protein [Armatimonadota bacterium]
MIQKHYRMVCGVAALLFLVAGMGLAGEVVPVRAEEAGKPYETTDLSQLRFPDRYPHVFYSPEEVAAVRKLALTPGAWQRGHYVSWKALTDAFVLPPKPGEDPYLESGGGLGKVRLLKGRVPRVSPGLAGEAYLNQAQCPKDAAVMVHTEREDGTWEHRCSQCDSVFTDPAFDGNARGVLNSLLGLLTSRLAWVYVVEGDRRYGEVAREILLDMARNYPKCCGAMSTHRLGEDEALCRFVTGYDLLHDTDLFTDAERKQIEEDLFRPAAAFFVKWADSNGRLNNRGLVHNSTVAAIGCLLNDKTLVDHALNSPRSGFNALLANCLDEDGLWDEGLGYQGYTLSGGLLPIAESVYHSGINLYRNPDFQRMVLTPLQLTWPGMNEDSSAAYRVFFYDRLKDPKFAAGLTPGEMPVRPGEAMWLTPEWQAAPPLQLQSRHLPGFGHVMLRAGQGESQLLASLSYGPEAMRMGHAPGIKFQLDLASYGLSYTMSTPCAGYTDAITGGFGRQAVAHNTLVADELGQEPGVGAADFFEQAPIATITRVRDAQEAYPGIHLNRTLALTPRYLVDLSQVSSRTPHRYDMPYRLYGDLQTEVPLRPVEGPLGWRYGYQYLPNVREARTDGPWTATWALKPLEPNLPAKGVKLTMLPEVGTQVVVADSPGQDANRLNVYQKAGVAVTEKMPVIIGRRWAAATTFASVLEPFTGRTAVRTVNKLPVTQEGRRVESGEAVGLTVTAEGEATAFLAAYAPGVRHYGAHVLDGRMGVVSSAVDGALPRFLQLVKGTRLESGGRSLRADRPVSFWVQENVPGQVTVGMGTDSGGRVALEGRFSAGATVHQGDRGVALRRAGDGYIWFLAEPKGIYQVSGVGEWSGARMAVTQAPSLDVAPSPSLLKAAVAHDRVAAGVDRGVYRIPEGVASGKNLLQNPGFEAAAGEEGSIPGWETGCSYSWEKYRAKPACSITGVHGGKQALQLQEMNWYYTITMDGYVAQTVRLTPGLRRLDLSAHLKASRPTLARLCLLGYDPKWGWRAEGGVGEPVEVGAEWQRLSLSKEFGPNIEAVRVIIQREHQAFGGDLFVDDVQLEEEGAAP